MQIAFLTAAAMLAFAANSVLARQALSDAFIDPLAYTGIRLASGAAVLMCAAWWQSVRQPRTPGAALWAVTGRVRFRCRCTPSLSPSPTSWCPPDQEH